ncbi:YaaC family protein [Halalkalibacter sp. APA_J-10(15)]|uniref:YaaC family protein n=1 Tax=unclassified Halalkalibacter TaxID=2893063 RepID=UPI001FF204F3|nr:YaaC family protein [Halalkalibacter sp. APA_J-10(15)]MCK0473928.1 YaaC family protein [Halalkalibacter sp. APA_J-10(15)]
MDTTELFLPYFSATYTRKYLTSSYKKLNLTQPKTKSYHSAYSFIYHLQHGQLYMKQASLSPTELQPILLFYGLVQLLKACVLAIDPTYPANSQVLAHGVTTRKRKKTSYHFLDDEVKIQKHGLFSHFSDKMFHVKQLESEKFKMNTLFEQLGDMHELIHQMNGSPISYRAQKESNSIQLPSELLDSYHMTVSRFERYLSSFPTSGYSTVHQINEQRHHLHLTLQQQPTIQYSAPWLYDRNGNLYLLKSYRRDGYRYLPELAIHYLLLYNLSMVCRYEAEWWGELLHTFDGEDLPYILHYLHVAQEKIPLLIAKFLQDLVI